MTDEVLKTASSLETVIDRFETDIARKSLNYDFVLVTDGQLHIRQCLFPEAQRKNIKLPNYYYSFHDLRKEFMAARPNSSVMTIKDMLNGNQKYSHRKWQLDISMFFHIIWIYTVFISDIEAGDLEKNLEPSTRDAQLMAKIILKLICDGKLKNISLMSTLHYYLLWHWKIYIIT